MVFSDVQSNVLSATFTGSPEADGYLIVKSTTASLKFFPAKFTQYTNGVTFGTGTVLTNTTTNSFTAAGLSPSTNYFFSVYAYKNCPEGIRYYQGNPLSGSVTTLPICTAPLTQPAGLSFGTSTVNSINGSFTGSGADQYLVLISSASSLTASPVNGINYLLNDSLGGGKVIQNGSGTSFSATELNSSSNYYIHVFAAKTLGCSGGPAYNSTTPLTGSIATLVPPCAAPSSQATNLIFSDVSPSGFSGSFTPAAATGHLILISSSASLSQLPVNGVSYTNGTSLGNATVLANNSNSFSASSLNSNTSYYLFVFSYNNTNCSGGNTYQTANPLAGSQSTMMLPCVAPAAQASNLNFSGVTTSSITGTFTPTSASGYLVLMSTSSSLTQQPLNGVSYTGGMSLGNATVINNNTNSFTANSLSSNTNYYFFVYAFNNTICTGGPVYQINSPLSGVQNTLLPTCVAPSSQASNLNFSGVTTTSITGTFSPTSATGYVVLMSTSSTLTQQPVNGVMYTGGASLGNAIVVNNSSNSFTANSLSGNTNYYFFVYAYNNATCTGGPAYQTTSPLTASQSTLMLPCVAPSGQATDLNFSGITTSSISGTFAPSSASGYVVLMSTSSSLTQQPVNGTSYTGGTTLGNATVISNSANSFTANSLNANTAYYFFIYAFNNSTCTGGPVYLTSSPLSGAQNTLMPPCVAPTAPVNLVFSAITSSTLTGTFTAGNGNGHLVLISTSSSLSQQPVNGVDYNVGNTLGNATVLSNSGNSFTASSLSASTVYYFYVYGFNNNLCTGGPVYQSAALTGNQSTTSSACVMPTSQATNLTFSNVSYNAITGSFIPGSSSQYLVLMTTTAGYTQQPLDGVSYAGGTTLGNATVISNTSNSFTATSLTANVVYYFYVIAFNSTGCTGGPKYRTTTPLSGNQETATPPVSALNFYFGNLHSHSSYSDGNADNTNKTPTDDYNFAKTALCMDFLGIAEHNHAEAGMSISNWQPGVNQANASTSNDFVALYGMEWGTISTGGHVVVYGIDSLIGWETNNYQIYVAKGDYTGTNGLFKILARNGNAFGYMAHPNSSDYNNLVTGSFNSMVDESLVGSAVESGPAFSTDTTYSDPSGTPMEYLSYYRSLLAKGYKVGPTVDHDNHNMTFGKTATSRLVILSPTLTKQNLLSSMRQRRFYASQDCAARISFGISTKPMGSVITQSGAPVINVSTITSASISSVKIMYGVPGSGTNAVQLTSTTSSTLNYTDTGLTSGNTRYYYLDITETDGKRIITAPIWYTRQ